MRWSQSFLVTLREVPGDAEVVSHQLLYRAGCIQKLAAGIYSYTPFGFRSLKKMIEIVREEMDATGALEVDLPILQPKELWVESGRWDRYQDEGILFHLKDRKEGEFALAPTAEEAVTDMVRRSVTSWRQLPFNLYQIRTKFRDEIRPRFGLLRGREFLMKDAYSFDLDQKGLDAHYGKMDARVPEDLRPLRPRVRRRPGRLGRDRRLGVRGVHGRRGHGRGRARVLGRGRLRREHREGDDGPAPGAVGGGGGEAVRRGERADAGAHDAARTRRSTSGRRRRASSRR